MDPLSAHQINPIINLVANLDPMPSNSPPYEHWEKRWTPRQVQEYQKWLYLTEEVVPKLNQLVDEYERERIVEEKRKIYEEKEKTEWIYIVLGGPSCDRRYSHYIPPDLPSTLFESDFCSSTVAILRTALLRLYKGYRLLNLQAA